MIESRCGLLCGDCLYREQMGCKGCVNMDKPFWADSCPVKSCCEARKHQHCGKCDSFVCPLLHTFAYDMEQSDNGARIEQCKSGEKNNGIKKRIFTIHFRALTALEEITYQAMMGKFILYFRRKMVGGIHDNRLLVKQIKSAISYMPTACHESPALKKK